MFRELKEKAFRYYEENELKVDIAFFLAGFIFDVFTLADIDDPLSLVQQVVYLLITGSVLYFEFLHDEKLSNLHERYPKAWVYRTLLFHFLLGSLLSMYSLFYLKSSSIFSSIIFVVLIMGLMVANELKSVQKSGLDMKLGLYTICVFSFFSMIFPVILGFVGLVSFLLTLLMTAFFTYGVYRLLLRKIPNPRLLSRKLLVPGSSVLGIFLVFYFLGWIPPVPLSVQEMGVYHNIEKKDNQYILSHEKTWYRFWNKGDQDFRAQPGDKIYFFAKIFSPSRFSDSVILHWYYKDPRQGWVSSDQIPMAIRGGRQGGFRGFSIKQNYQEGEYRVSVETTDRREIGRLYFDVVKVEPTPEREFQKTIE